jgi:hypothetical protein
MSYSISKGLLRRRVLCDQVYVLGHPVHLLGSLHRPGGQVPGPTPDVGHGLALVEPLLAAGQGQLRLALLAQVTHHSDHAGHRAVLVVHGGHGHRDRDDEAVDPHMVGLDLFEPLPHQRQLVVPDLRGPVGGKQQHVDPASHGLVGQVAVNSLCGPVPSGDHPVGVGHQHGIGRGLQDGGEQVRHRTGVAARTGAINRHTHLTDHLFPLRCAAP